MIGETARQVRQAAGETTDPGLPGPAIPVALAVLAPKGEEIIIEGVVESIDRVRTRRARLTIIRLRDGIDVIDLLVWGGRDWWVRDVRVGRVIAARGVADGGGRLNLREFRT